MSSDDEAGMSSSCPRGGRISLARGGRKKKDGGANWVVFAGGAIAMAVSVAFGRKKLLEEGGGGSAEGAGKEDLEETACATSREDDDGECRARIEDEEEAGIASAAPPQDSDGNHESESAALQPSEPVPNGMIPHWESQESAALPLPPPPPPRPPTEPDFEFRSMKTKRPASTDPSPPASKCCKQQQVRQSTSITSVTQMIHPNPKDGDVEVQGVQTLSSALQSPGVTTTRRSEVLHRLRQQIKSRDVIIYEMQAQLSDQDQMITMHRNHSADLRDCVQAISTKLFEANLDIQRLQRALMAHRAKQIVDLDDEFIDYAVSEFNKQWAHPKYAPMQKGVGEILREARTLTEEVERLRKEKDAKDKLAQAKSRQCEMLSMRLTTLTTELQEVKAAAQGKQRLLELKEQEYLKMASVVQDLQRKLDIEARDNEWLLMALYAVSGKGGGKPGKELQAYQMDRCP